MHSLKKAAFLALPLAMGCASGGKGANDPIRVLVYNIHAGTDAKRVNNLSRVAEVVRSSRADIVLLQEVDNRTKRSGGVDQLSELASKTGFHGRFGKAIDYDGGEYGIGILSRWPIVSDSMIPLPVANPGANYEARGALIATISRPGTPMTMVNTHLDASRDEYRLQQAKGLVAIATEHNATFVGGDFNSVPGSGVVALLSAAGFRDAYADCGTGDGLSFPVDVPVKRIDYLMIAANVDCRSASVLSADASDQRAVLFELR